MMPAISGRTPSLRTRGGAAGQHVAQGPLDERRGAGADRGGHDQAAQGGVAPVPRQGADDSRRERRVQARQDVGGGRGPLRRHEADDHVLRDLGQRAPDVGRLLRAERRADETVDLVGRKRFGEEDAGLAGVAEQIGARGEVGRELVHQTVERRRRDGAEPGGRARHPVQIGLVEALEQPSRHRRSEHQQQRRRLLGAGQDTLSKALGHGRTFL